MTTSTGRLRPKSLIDPSEHGLYKALKDLAIQRGVALWANVLASAWFDPKMRDRDVNLYRARVPFALVDESTGNPWVVVLDHRAANRDRVCREFHDAGTPYVLPLDGMTPSAIVQEVIHKWPRVTARGERKLTPAQAGLEQRMRRMLLLPSAAPGGSVHAQPSSAADPIDRFQADQLRTWRLEAMQSALRSWVIWQETQLGAFIEVSPNLKSAEAGCGTRASGALRPEEARRLATSRVDILITTAAPDFAPLLVIEHDGSHHGKPEKAARDAINNRLLNEAGIPTLRVTYDEHGEFDVAGEDNMHLLDIKLAIAAEYLWSRTTVERDARRAQHWEPYHDEWRSRFDQLACERYGEGLAKLPADIEERTRAFIALVAQVDASLDDLRGKFDESDPTNDDDFDDQVERQRERASLTEMLTDRGVSDLSFDVAIAPDGVVTAEFSCVLPEGMKYQDSLRPFRVAPIEVKQYWSDEELKLAVVRFFCCRAEAACVRNGYERTPEAVARTNAREQRLREMTGRLIEMRKQRPAKPATRPSA